MQDDAALRAGLIALSEGSRPDFHTDLLSSDFRTEPLLEHASTSGADLWRLHWFQAFTSERLRARRGVPFRMPLPEFGDPLDRVSDALRVTRDEVLCHSILADESVCLRVWVVVLTIRKSITCWRSHPRENSSCRPRIRRSTAHEARCGPS